MSHSASSSSAAALADYSAPARPRGGGGALRLSETALPATTLSPADIAAISKAREARWRPGLADQPWHSEIFAGTADASGAGLALALARDALRVAASEDDALAEPLDRRQVLWVQEARAIKRGGRPYLHGLPKEWRDRLIHVEAKTPEDALFALEEGLRCRDLACVIGEIVGNPRALDFTASRRLSLAAEKHGVALWLVRLEAEPDLSSARMRWRAEAAPSPPPRWNGDAPGVPHCQAELFRARSHAPGTWILHNDDEDPHHQTHHQILRARKPGSPEEQPSKDGASHASPGTALARHYRRARSAGGAGSALAPDSRHLVRETVGRSLAARARL
ncbi:MAG: recA-like protein [Pseudomonadota bacterium]